MRHLAVFEYKIGEIITFPIFTVDDPTKKQGDLRGVIIGCGLVKNDKHIYTVRLLQCSQQQLCGCDIYSFDENFVSVDEFGNPNQLEDTFIPLKNHYLEE